MQFLQSRTAQEYNYRKGRKGAFWEDRYHATAIDSDIYLIHCMVYISMNMVRAAVVKHPLDWHESGYFEIEFPKKRYCIINYAALLETVGFNSLEELQKNQREWIKEIIDKNEFEREPKWTESIAVGSECFIEKIKDQLSIKAKSRIIKKSGEDYALSESEIPYNAIFDTKNTTLRANNGQ